MSIAADGPVLWKKMVSSEGVLVALVKLPDDPMCLRASLGGDPTVGYYLTWRGDEAAVRHLLETALRAFSAFIQEKP